MIYTLLIICLLISNSLFFSKTIMSKIKNSKLFSQPYGLIGFYLLWNAFIFAIVAGYNVFIKNFWYPGSEHVFIFIFLALIIAYFVVEKKQHYIMHVALLALMFVFVEQSMNKIFAAMFFIYMITILLKANFKTFLLFNKKLQ